MPFSFEGYTVIRNELITKRTPVGGNPRIPICLYCRTRHKLKKAIRHRSELVNGTAVEYEDSSFTFHAVNFAERGILTAERSSGKPNSYVFAITPQDSPEFFLEKTESPHHSFASPTAVPIPLAAASG